MKISTDFRFTRDIVYRIFADILMVNFAFIMSLVIRYLAEIVINRSASFVEFSEYMEAYLTGFPILTPLSVLVFFTSGFYTYGRVYRSRYKALIIIQAVSLTYLIFGAISYLAGDFLQMPRGAYFIAWGLTLLVIFAARLWSDIWRTIMKNEDELFAESPENRKVEHVLVIGGAGYIGSALLPKLLERGYRVRLLDLLLYGTEPIEDIIDHPKLEIMQADFRQVDRVVEAMRDIDAVIHLGAIVGDPACALDEDLTIEVNVMATRMIAEVAKGSGVERFVFASTCSVYGASDEILDEHSDLHPVSLYARSKIASEKILLKMNNRHFSPVILRFSTIYGLSGRTRFDLVVNLLTAKAMFDKEITVFGGDQWRPFIHVDDAAFSVLKALQAPLELVKNETFNVGSDEQNYTISQTGELIKRLITQAKLINMGSDTDKRNYKVSFHKIRNILHFIPNWSMEQGIRQVEEAIRTKKVKDYREAKYSNVKFLSEEAASLLVKREKAWMDELLTDQPTKSLQQKEVEPSPVVSS
ncbi:MAG: NAD-dependent epimerase/dehydratase [Calditrichia bacterium]